MFLTFRVSCPVEVNVLCPQTEQCMVKCLKVNVSKFSFPQFAQRIFFLRDQTPFSSGGMIDGRFP